MTHLCNISFESQWGVVDGNDIHIDGYRNKYIGQIIKCRNGHILDFSDGKIRKAYFSHKYSGDVGGYPMTEWHAEWQSHFPNYEKEFPKLGKPTQNKNRRADVVLNPSKILEIQHSKYEKAEIDNRKHDYALHNVDIIWLVDGNNTINVIIQTDRIILEFTSDYWKYESFTSYEYIFIDIDSKIYKVYPNQVECHMIDVENGREKAEFIDALKLDIDLWPNSVPLNQCKLFIRQQGAGNGKTYGIVRMLEDDDKKHYKNFIYITKQHSAKHIIKCEFENQQKVFQYLKNITIGETSDKKKYIITYLNTLSNVNCQLSISTLDAFAHSIGNKNHHEYDKFEGLINSIIDGHIETKRDGTMKFAGINPKLNKETLLVIDEFQDPAEYYAQAIIKIMQQKYIDVYIVGDKLQSISNAKNAFIYFTDHVFPGITVEKIVPTNTCRRFTHPDLVNFVNHMIPFAKYDLPPIIPYKYDILNETEPALHWIIGGFIDSKKKDIEEEITREINKIMECFKTEAVDNNRFPQDFLIVTPFTKQNPLVDALLIAINIFWKEKYTDDPELMYSWNRDANVDNYYQYAIFHKSEDGASIDLSESEYSTRIVSCHSAKGDGRNVVFVIGFTESAVKRYSQESNNLVYDSFLHVAITRAKQKMYIRYIDNNDEISKRINEYRFNTKNITDKDVKPNIEINNQIKYGDFIDNVSNKHFVQFYENIIQHANLPKISENQTNDKRIIDMGNHMIRYSSLIVNIYLQIINKERQNYNKDIKSQIQAIFYTVYNSILERKDTLKDFYESLDNNSKNKYSKKKYILPILKLSNRGNDYNQYFDYIWENIVNIFKYLKATLNDNKEIKLCPLECIILYYMVEIINNGKFSNINMIDVYNIIDIYRDSFNFNDNHNMIGHDNCDCKHIFKNPTHQNIKSKNVDNMKLFLKNHFEKVNEIKHIMSIFHDKYPNINWLIHHPITYEGNHSYFKMRNHFDLIGYDANTVAICYVKPQFNLLNYNEVLMHSILDTYFLKNIKKGKDDDEYENNYNKFNGKQIITCVFSLELKEPYYIDWKDKDGRDLIDINKKIILQTINNYILEKYKLENNRMFYFYKYWRDYCPEIHKSPSAFIRFIKDEIQKTKDLYKDIPIMPKYIETFIDNIEKEVDNVKRKERNEIIKKYDNNTTFMEEINLQLDKSIRYYLNMEDEEEDEYEDA